MSADAAATHRRLMDDLAGVGRDRATGGYRRFAYAPEDLVLREWFTGEGQARGLDVSEDRAGNLWAWWGDPDAGGGIGDPGDGRGGGDGGGAGGPGGGGGGGGIVTGSHLDSVPGGGPFDGPLGITSAFAAIDELRGRGAAPRRPIAVVAFADEEGGRFGIACAGSRLLTGGLDPDRALGLRDDDGITMAEALRASGREPAHVGRDDEALARVGAFVELHVEQGRGLVELGAPVGVGTAIRPHGRWRFDLRGRPDHAGTTRLEDRDDPMIAQARLVLAARARATVHGAVATVGRVQVEPNGVNAIPSLVRAWLDARADDEAVVRRVVDEVAFAVGTEPIEESWTPRTELDADLRERVRAAVARGTAEGAEVPALATGAGHDAGILAAAGIPSAMLFVRNPTGVSHAPDEHAEDDDCVAGIHALADVLEELACRT